MVVRNGNWDGVQTPLQLIKKEWSGFVKGSVRAGSDSVFFVNKSGVHHAFPKA